MGRSIGSACPIIASDAEEPYLGQANTCPALVDTDATVASITRNIAHKLKLVPSGKIEVQTASGLASVDVYDVKLGFLHPMGQDKDGSIYGQIEILPSAIRAPEFEAGDSKFQALVGRDILSKGILTLSYDGHYSFLY